MLHFVIPFYNAAAGLAANVAAVDDYLAREMPGDYEIVLTDDGSTDGSREAAEALAAVRPAVRVIGYAPNRGRGFAVRFAAATCHEGVLLFSDLDLPLTTSLSHIRAMVDRLKDHAVVVGSRFLPGSATRRLWLREAVGRVHRCLVRSLLPGLDVSDPDAGFKGFDLARLQAMSGVCREDRWSWDMEVLAVARANGLAIAEIPIDWNERHGGHATSVSILRDGGEEFAGMRRIRKNLRAGRYRL